MKRIFVLLLVPLAAFSQGYRNGSQTQEGANNYIADTGAANAYVMTLSPAIVAYRTGAQYCFKAVNANTTTSTLAINGLTALTIKKLGATTNLASGDISAGKVVCVVYDGTQFEMQSPIDTAPGGNPTFDLVGAGANANALTVTTGGSLAPTNTGVITANKMRSYTVGTLPSHVAGQMAFVTDGASIIDCTTGSGSTKVFCVDDGTTWIARFPNVFTTAGDIVYGGASGLPTRLAIGAATTVLHGGASTPAYAQIGTTDIAANAVTSAKVDGSVANSTSAAVTTLTDGATVTWAIGSVFNANASLTFTVHSGSRTLNITGPVTGGNYIARIVQDATGGEGLTLGTGCTWKVSGGGTGAVTPSTGANAIDVLAFYYDGTNCYANFNKNFN